LLNNATQRFAAFWRQPIHLRADITVDQPLTEVAFGAGIRSGDGVHVFTVHHDDDGRQPLWQFAPGRYFIEFTLETELRPGTYRLHIGADQGHTSVRNILSVDAVDIDVLDYAANGDIPLQNNTGLVNGRSTWLPPRRTEPGTRVPAGTAGDAGEATSP